MSLKIRTVFLYVSISIIFLLSLYHILSPPSSFSIITGKPPYDAVSIHFDSGTIIQLKPNDAVSSNSASFTPIDEIKAPNDAVSVQFDANEITTGNVSSDFTLNDQIRRPNDAVSIRLDSGEIFDGNLTCNSTNFTRVDEINAPNDVVSIQFDSGAIIDGNFSCNATSFPRIDEFNAPNDAVSIQFDSVLSNSTGLTRIDEIKSSNCEKCESISAISSNVAVLFPAWEVLVIVSESPVIGNVTNSTYNYCLFHTNEITPARFSGTLTNPDRKTYTCQLPNRVRRKLPFRQPELVNSPENVTYSLLTSSATEMLRWNYIVYDIVKNGENDVVLLAKGMNKRQGVNRSPTEFKCVFGEDVVNGVITSVTSSVQEVFRCEKPDLTALSQRLVKASLLVIQSNQLVPSVAYYSRKRKIVKDSTKSLLCACTMVYNVAKFLKEWVVYHSEIGVDKFVLYDNGSDDDLGEVVNSLRLDGYDVETRFWLWPKTQEAGFSHAVLLAKNECKWMMYIDVDEFVYSPLWKSSKLDKMLLHSVLPQYPFGQVMIRCYEFGPSNQSEHPLTGVTQGYNCRKRLENRHKSIILLDAVHESLENAIHHFKLKDGYKSKKMELEKMVVNHYKYQAWAEFKAKFRRRVSAYVVDWTQTVNLKSNDRAPGLGHLAIEPEGWEEKFCEVYDNRLRDLTRRWFGRQIGRSEYRMNWQN